VRQIEAAAYILLERPEEMYRFSMKGKTEACWGSVTKDMVFIPLIDPTKAMNLMYAPPASPPWLTNIRLGETTLKYPISMGKVAAELTAPKPDIAFFSHMNLSSLEGDLWSASTRKPFMSTPTLFTLDDDALLARLSWRESQEICCGARSAGFHCPTFVVERKSDSGSLFYAENQFLGSIRCMLEAQAILKERINSHLPVLPMGLVNVGNLVEFWAAWVNPAGKVNPEKSRTNMFLLDSSSACGGFPFV